MEKEKLTVEESGRRGGEANAARHDREHFQQMGQAGGRATKQKYGREHYQKMGRLGAARRFGTRDPAP